MGGKFHFWPIQRKHMKSLCVRQQHTSVVVRSVHLMAEDKHLIPMKSIINPSKKHTKNVEIYSVLTLMLLIAECRKVN